MESTEEEPNVDHQIMTDYIEEIPPQEKGDSSFRQRDPVQVQAYWNAVRDALRVADDEIYSDEYVVTPEHVERTTSAHDRPQGDNPLDECCAMEHSPSDTESIYSLDHTSEVASDSASEYPGSVSEHENDDTPRTSFAQSVKEGSERGLDDETSNEFYDEGKEECRERTAKIAAQAAQAARLVESLRKQDDKKNLRRGQLDAPPAENTPTDVIEQKEVEEEKPKAKGKAMEGGSKTWPRATVQGPKKAWKKVKRALRTQNTKTW